MAGPTTDLEVAGLRLAFLVKHSRVGAYVQVTDAQTGTWVGNVFMLHRTDGALLRHSYAYREHLGRGQFDRHGTENRNAICEYATKIYRDG
ncbi:hypothetical protein [Glycomyces buryatensis]|uniref:Uncharacterized protein n=1 Tax=Glycomyces buryatensis TaxID=2570927 RepID=A0A4S8PVT0_9ACTN|nr:hypothetical protein [Glycomyces buryatensis]THV35697.1 hypothetical protein FAB82_22745 [Glycomyces buryatensis]